MSQLSKIDRRSDNGISDFLTAESQIQALVRRGRKKQLGDTTRYGIMAKIFGMTGQLIEIERVKSLFAWHGLKQPFTEFSCEFIHGRTDAKWHEEWQLVSRHIDWEAAQDPEGTPKARRAFEPTGNRTGWKEKDYYKWLISRACLTLRDGPYSMAWWLTEPFMDSKARVWILYHAFRYLHVQEKMEFYMHLPSPEKLRLKWNGEYERHFDLKY